ncbi:MAG: DUF362 domain-containing protein [Planctomycetota bacterium]|nr:DUF362 domain-containing protein [Planctomycetota bacterium]
MDRRDFLKAAAAAGLGLAFAGDMAGAPGIRNRRAAAGEAPARPDAPADIVAVRNGEPEAMFDLGIAAMGGIGRFVKPGQTVTLKVNVSWDVRPELAGNTHPGLVDRVVRRCLEAGASRVYVVDHNIENGQRCYQTSGIGDAARSAGAMIAPAEAERYYQSVPVAGKILTGAKVHETILGADVLVSLPVLKHHGGAGMSGSLKNFMGAVWDRRYYHRNNLQQCIADFFAVRKPDLNIVDAYRVITQNGPRGGSAADVAVMKMQILSTDIVAADAAGARLFGRSPDSFGHVKIAHEMGFGEIDPSRLVARRITA